MKKFNYCKVCRRNHQEGRKHKHTKKHQEILNEKLQRFEQNIREYDQYLHLPTFRKPPSKGFWCLCCEKEIHEKAEFMGWNVFHHLADTSHHERVRSFCITHNGDQERTLREKVVLSDVELTQYMQACAERTTKAQRDRQKKTHQEAPTNKLRQQPTTFTQKANSLPTEITEFKQSPSIRNIGPQIPNPSTTTISQTSCKRPFPSSQTGTPNPPSKKPKPPDPPSSSSHLPTSLQLQKERLRAKFKVKRELKGK